MIEVATDGSCLGNPGPAGWAWYVDDTTWACGSWAHGTNNMGELAAIAHAAAELPAEADLRILADSQYAIKAYTAWAPGWRRRGWVTSKGAPVANRDIIEAGLDALAARTGSTTFEWVRGHSGHPLNEAVDRLALYAATIGRDGFEERSRLAV